MADPTKVLATGRFIEDAFFSGDETRMVGFLVALLLFWVIAVFGNCVMKPHRLGYFAGLFLLLGSGFGVNTYIWRLLGPSLFDWFRWVLAAVLILYAAISQLIEPKEERREGPAFIVLIGYLLRFGVPIYLLVADFRSAPPLSPAETCNPYSSRCYATYGFHGEYYSDDRFYNGIKIIDKYDYQYLEKIREVIKYRHKMSSARQPVPRDVASGFIRPSDREISAQIRLQYMKEKKSYRDFVNSTLNFPSDLSASDAGYVKNILLQDDGWRE